jgi:ribose-phosphate pyrophosphokinase
MSTIQEPGTPRKGRITVKDRLASKCDVFTWKILLFHHHTMEDLANRIARHFPEHIKLGKINYERFPDGWPNISVHPDSMAIIEVAPMTVYLGAFDRPDYLFEQFALLYAMPRFLTRNFRVICPYFPTATMERAERKGEIATAKTFAKLCSAIPFGVTGPPVMTIFDIHSLAEEFFFDNIHVDLQSAIPLIQDIIYDELADMKDVDGLEWAIAFPDDGAWKRFHLCFPDVEDVVCLKVREGNKRKITIKEGNPQGRHCIIVDDLVQTGGTLLNCAQALKDAGAVKISCYVTHGIFPNESWKKFVDNDLIDTVWLTDSIPSTANTVRGIKPFQILSLADLIGIQLYTFFYKTTTMT